MQTIHEYRKWMSVLFVCYINQWPSYSPLCFVAEDKGLIQSLTWAKGKKQGLVTQQPSLPPSYEYKNGTHACQMENELSADSVQTECVAWWWAGNPHDTPLLCDYE